MNRFDRRAFFLLIALLFFGGDVLSQYRVGPFAPPVGQNGTNAMYKDSAAFEAWAVNASVTRGPKDTSDLSQGYASAGSPSEATDKADVSGVVSLGDHGTATLTFDQVIQNGPGPDLAVFENSFDDSFLELAFLEVSSNGDDFVRFPAVSLTDTSSQVGSFGTLDATNLYNLAGKYRGGYGTPFDLEELSGEPALNLDSVTHVRLVDVIGCVQDSLSTVDSNGRAVNDPWPTAFSSGGFDLDAVGAIHTPASTGIRAEEEEEPRVRYASAERMIRIEGMDGKISIKLFDLSGRRVLSFAATRNGRVQVPASLEKGIYLLRLENGTKGFSRKLMIR
ncbi:MAG: T9SS type A sorting domain-containing protein [Flavobacteriales bacterium]